MIRLILALTILTALPLAAGSITTTTATCTAGTSWISQTNPSSAQCSASDFPRDDISDANATISIGLLAGFVSAWPNDNASAYVSEYFTESFVNTTTLIWSISVSLSGPWAYVALDLGPLQEEYEEYTPQGSGDWVIKQTLPAGDYTFSAITSVSDEGSASFSADPPVPEPSSTLLLFAGLVVIGMAAILWTPKRRGRYSEAMMDGCPYCGSTSVVLCICDDDPEPWLEAHQTP